MLDKNIAHHSKILDYTTKLPFSKMGNIEVPCDAPSAPPSDRTNIPSSLDFLLDPSIFPGFLQDQK